MSSNQPASLSPSLPKTQPQWQLFLNQLRNWRALLGQAFIGQSGTATFAAATTVAVTFAQPLASTAYKVLLGGNAAGYVWPTAQATTGFTLNCSASNSNSTDWAVIA